MNCISCGSSLNSVLYTDSFLKVSITKCDSCELITTGQSVEQLDTTMKNYYENTTPIGEIKDIIELDELVLEECELINSFIKNIDTHSKKITNKDESVLEEDIIPFIKLNK